MTKSCPICGAKFETSDRRTVTCGKASCVKASRSKNCKERPSLKPVTTTNFIRKENLPPPECLPADYLKQCADLWLSLTTEAEVPRRVV